MSQRVIHDMDAVLTSSNPAVLQVALEVSAPFVLQGAASNRLTAQPGSLNATAAASFNPPLDLSPFEELRFWIRSTRAATGSPRLPFYLEFAYTDTGDLPGELHRWFVPVNEADKWEHRRLGIAADRRTAIDRMEIRCREDLPFVCRIDEVLAVREEMLADVEAALSARLEGVALPGVSGVPLSQTAPGGSTQVVLPPTGGFQSGNLVRLTGGSAGDELRDVAAAATTATDTTLTLGTPLVGTFTAPGAAVSVSVPVVIEVAPGPAPAPVPSILLTPVDAREDMDRTGYAPQRDSFRIRGPLTVCSVRPAARAYGADYQIIIRAQQRAQQLYLHTQLLRRLSADIPLRVNGVPSPVAILPPPALDDRETGVLAPIYVRIGTRMETAPRVEEPWVRTAEARSAPKDAPLDQEGIVIQL